MDVSQKRSPTILTVLRSDVDFASLQQFIPSQWAVMLRGRTLAEARTFLNREPVDIVVTDVDLGDHHGWKDMLEAAQSASATPRLIVAARSADEFLWAEVLHRGGFDVLNQPFEKEEVLRVIDSAFRDRRRERPRPRGAGLVLRNASVAQCRAKA